MDNHKLVERLHRMSHLSAADPYIADLFDDAKAALETLARENAELARLLAEVFADHSKLNSLAWMDATAGMISKQDGA